MLKSRAGSLNRLINLRAASLADCSDRRFVRRGDDLKGAASSYESPMDKRAKTAAMFVQPRMDENWALRSRSVFHGFENLFNCGHRIKISPQRHKVHKGQTKRCSS